MSLAFNLHNDKDWRDDNPLQSHTMVSLLALLRFYAEDFVKICNTLGYMSGEFEALKRKWPDRRYLPKPEGPALHIIFKALRDTSVKMKLKVITDRATELIELLDKPGDIELSMLDHMINELPDKLITEFENELLLRVRPDHVKHYEQKGTFLGQDIIQKFPPELAEDAAEAGNCFSLERYTACVFHLMRIMERLVQDFATKVNATKKDGTQLDVKHEEWYQIEHAISREIDKMSRGDLKDKYSAALSSLCGVRGGRALVMHPKQTYTKEQAKTWLESVKLFVEAYSALP